MSQLLRLIVCLVPVSGFSQTYSIPSHKIAGGGGVSTSTNAQYSVSGTIGPSDVSPVMSGGIHSVTGGFPFEEVSQTVLQ